MKIEEFLCLMNLKVEISSDGTTYAPGRPHDYYCADIKNLGIKENADSIILGGAVGWGRTPDDALASLVRQIQGKHGVIDSQMNSMREFGIPMIDTENPA